MSNFDICINRIEAVLNEKESLYSMYSNSDGSIELVLRKKNAPNTSIRYRLNESNIQEMYEEIKKELERVHEGEKS